MFANYGSLNHTIVDFESIIFIQRTSSLFTFFKSLLIPATVFYFLSNYSLTKGKTHLKDGFRPRRDIPSVYSCCCYLNIFSSIYSSTALAVGRFKSASTCAASSSFENLFKASLVRKMNCGLMLNSSKPIPSRTGSN